MGKTGKSVCGWSGFDFLAGDVRLTVDGRARTPSKVGACLSMACLVSFGLLSYVIVSSYLDTSQPTITAEKSVHGEKPLVDLRRNYHYPILFFLEDDTHYLQPAEVARYVHVSFFHMSYVQTAESENQMVTREVRVVPCKELLARGEFSAIKVDNEGFVQGYYREHGHCIDDEGQPLTLGGPGRGLTYESVNLYFFPCVLTDGSCKPRQELRRLVFYIGNPQASANFGDYREPVKYVTENLEFEGIIPEVFQARIVSLVATQVRQERGLFSRAETTHAYTAFEKEAVKLYSRDPAQNSCASPVYPACMPYFAQNFFLSGSGLTVTRKYKGLVEAGGEIGGMAKLLVLLFSLLYGLYYRRLQRAEFARLVYGRLAPGSARALQAHKRVSEDLDLLRIVRELKLLKLLLVRLLPEKRVLAREELLDPGPDLLEYLKQPLDLPLEDTPARASSRRKVRVLEPGGGPRLTAASSAPSEHLLLFSPSGPAQRPAQLRHGPPERGRPQAWRRTRVAPREPGEAASSRQAAEPRAGRARDSRE